MTKFNAGSVGSVCNVRIDLSRGCGKFDQPMLSKAALKDLVEGAIHRALKQATRGMGHLENKEPVLKVQHVKVTRVVDMVTTWIPRD